MPVLILTGESSDQEGFADVVKGDLGGEYHIITMNCSALDAHNNPADQEYAISELADAALQMIEAFDIDYAAVVGHSFGCSIAVELASNFHGAIAVGLCGAPSPYSTRAELSASSPQKRYVLRDTKEDLSAFLRRADDLYKENLAGPVVWYGG